MTRKYAIKILSDMAAKMPCNTADSNAVYMAISALGEQESLEEKQATSDERQKTSDLISVEEQLPEEAIRVLVRLSGINPPIGFPRMDTDRIIDGRWVRWGDLVTHWMPLPETPKEDVS